VKRFIIGLIVGLLLPVVGGYLFIKMGMMPMAASGATPLPGEEKIAHMALSAQMHKTPFKTSPVPADETNMTQGAHVYVEHCAFCHGLPGQPASYAAKGMFPLPPQLMTKDAMVTDDPVGGIYWKASNGIRMTGMPGFAEMLNDTELWQVSQMLKNADKLPPSTMAALSKPAQAAAPAAETPAPAPTPKSKSKKK